MGACPSAHGVCSRWMVLPELERLTERLVSHGAAKTRDNPMKTHVVSIFWNLWPRKVGTSSMIHFYEPGSHEPCVNCKWLVAAPQISGTGSTNFQTHLGSTGSAALAGHHGIAVRQEHGAMESCKNVRNWIPAYVCVVNGCILRLLVRSLKFIKRGKGRQGCASRKEEGIVINTSQMQTHKATYCW